MPPTKNAQRKAAAKKAAAPPIDAAAPGTLAADFSKPQATKAVKALLAHAEKAAREREETELIARDEFVWVNVNTKTGSTRKKLNPVKIQLPNPPLAPPPATSVCLFTKDPQREYKDLLEAHGIKFIERVVGVTKLKGKFKPFEPRRQLLKDHDLFLVDERVLPLMPKLLGKMFFEAKKQPIPVNLMRKDLKAELGRAIASTYFHPSTGTSHSVRIATVGVTTAEATLANLLAAVPAAVALVGGWDNVLSVGIKTNSSVLLPVWNAKLDGRFKADTDTDAMDQDAPAKEPSPVPVPVPAPVSAPAAAKSTADRKKDPAAGKKKSSVIGSGAAKTKPKVAAVGTAKKAKARK